MPVGTNLELNWAYIWAFTLNKPDGSLNPPLDNPLLDPTNDIMHFGKLSLHAEGGLAMRTTPQETFEVETQRRVLAGDLCTMYLALNNDANDATEFLHLTCQATMIFITP